MNNEAISNHSDIDSDDDSLASLIDQVSTEMKEHYDTEAVLPDFVTPICSINELYSCQRQIGRGATGVVFLVQNKQTHKQYALKRMLRSDHRNRSSFINEIQILKGINHPNIIHMNEAYISKEHYYLTTEYGAHGLLLERVITKKRFSETDAAHYIKKILDAVDYIHSKNIVHRDLKLSNIVFDRNSKLKLIDFGQSELITDYDEKDRNIFGSLRYLPPETLRTRTKYELFAGDMWPVGIMSYILTQGFYPFIGHDVESLLKNIYDTQLTWHCETQLSDECKDFIQSLLNKDVTKRLTAKEALKHSWIVKQTNENFKSFKKLFTKFQNQVMNESQETDTNSVLLQDTVEYCEESLSIDKILAEIDEVDIEKILVEIDAVTDESLQNKHKDTLLLFVPPGMMTESASKDLIIGI